MNEENTSGLGEKLFASLQENIKLFESLGDEVQLQTKTALQSQLNRMDLVTREEFDATLSALEKALGRVEELEVQLQALSAYKSPDKK